MAIKKNYKTTLLTSGFTIIELVVIITIFAIMSSIMLFNFTGFNKNIERNNLAQDIGLLIRKAQSYGTTSSTLGAGTLSDTNTLPSRYGLLFDYDANAATISTITLYKKIAIANSPVGYNQSTDIIIDTVSVTSPGVAVVACTPTNASTCLNPITDDVAIEFERPKPDPFVSSLAQLPFVIRLLPSDSSTTWYIVVTPTGNIYVKHT